MTFSQIIDYIESVLIDLPSEVVALIPGLVNTAQRRIEDDHGFRVMEKLTEYVTVTSQRQLGAIPVRYCRALDNPVVRDGTGADWPIEWIEREDQIARLYNADDPLDLGSPRHILETADSGFSVYPLPDGLCPVGSLSSDGEYRIRLPYLQRELTLSVGSVDDNWFTENAGQYLIDYAAAEGFLLNRNSSEFMKWNAKAILEKRRVIFLDKRSRLPRNLRLRPSPTILTKSHSRF